MKINVFLLICVVVPEYLSDDPQQKFDPLLKYSYRDTETKHVDLVHGVEWWKRFPGVEYGVNIAGHAEFPWVVHIKSFENTDRGDEWYSVGNLLTRKHVLTVCRGVTQFNCTTISRYCGADADCVCRVFGSNGYTLIKKNPKDLYVYWFPIGERHEHLFWYGEEMKIVRDDLVNGRDQVVTSITHPKCQWDKEFRWDMAVVIMKTGLYSLNKFANAIQLPLDKDSYLFDDPRLQYIEDRRMICYVASYQYNMTGFPTEYNFFKGYKVKYRVYPFGWDRCEEVLKQICRGEGCDNWRPSYPPRDMRIECWQTKSVVGTVCDHDRGAPVVCEGKVHGIVLRGATHFYCNPGIRMPFLMQRIVVDYSEFFKSGAFSADPIPPYLFRDLPDEYKYHKPSRTRGSLISSGVKNSSSLLLIFLLSLIFSYE